MTKIRDTDAFGLPTKEDMPDQPHQNAPLVSVVTATYNRSRAVRCAAQSVQAQTVTDWEHWVVGDACTDDTAEVVAALGDPRVHFHNLPENVGEQSGPNNEGLKRARGRYLAMLNHDDLWLPDHLELAIGALEASGADLVFTMALQVEREGHYVLHNWAPGRKYLPELFLPASSWVFRRELFERIGGWRAVQTIRNFPSQDWLFRAHLSGARLEFLPMITALFLPSRTRANCYLGNPGAEQERWLERIQANPAIRSELTLLSLRPHPPEPAPTGPVAPVPFLERLARARTHYGWMWRRAAALRIARWTGGHPTEWEVRLGGETTTTKINTLRQIRGLNALSKDKQSKRH